MVSRFDRPLLCLEFDGFRFDALLEFLLLEAEEAAAVALALPAAFPRGFALPFPFASLGFEGPGERPRFEFFEEVEVARTLFTSDWSLAVRLITSF